MGFKNVHGQIISELDAHLEQWAGRPVMDDVTGEEIMLDESMFLPLSPEQVLARDQGIWPSLTLLTDVTLLTFSGTS